MKVFTIIHFHTRAFELFDYAEAEILLTNLPTSVALIVCVTILELTPMQTDGNTIKDKAGAQIRIKGLF